MKPYLLLYYIFSFSKLAYSSNLRRRDGLSTIQWNSPFPENSKKENEKSSNCGLFLHGITNHSHFFNTQYENIQKLDQMLNERIIIEKNNYESWYNITEYRETSILDKLIFSLKRTYEDTLHYIQDIGDFSEAIGHLKEKKSVADNRSICVRYFASLFFWKGRFYCCGGWDYVSHTFSISWNCIITENTRNYNIDQMFPGRNLQKFEINFHHLKDFNGNDWSHYTTNLEGDEYSEKLQQAMASQDYSFLEQIVPFNYNPHDHHPAHGTKYDIVENLHNIRVIAVNNDMLVFLNESNSAWADTNRYLNLKNLDFITQDQEILDEYPLDSNSSIGRKDLARILTNVHVLVNDFTNQSSYNKSDSTGSRIRKYNSQPIPNFINNEWVKTQKQKHAKKNKYERLACEVAGKKFICLLEYNKFEIFEWDEENMRLISNVYDLLYPEGYEVPQDLDIERFRKANSGSRSKTMPYYNMYLHKLAGFQFCNDRLLIYFFDAHNYYLEHYLLSTNNLPIIPNAADQCNNQCAMFVFEYSSGKNQYGHISCYAGSKSKNDGLNLVTEENLYKDCHYKKDFFRNYGFDLSANYIPQDWFIKDCVDKWTENMWNIDPEKNKPKYKNPLDPINVHCEWNQERIFYYPMMNYEALLLILLIFMVIFVLIYLSYVWLYKNKRKKYGFIHFDNLEQFYLLGKPSIGCSASVYPCWFTVDQSKLDHEINHIEVTKVAMKQYHEQNINANNPNAHDAGVTHVTKVFKLQHRAGIENYRGRQLFEVDLKINNDKWPFSIQKWSLCCFETVSKHFDSINILSNRESKQGAGPNTVRTFLSMSEGVTDFETQLHAAEKNLMAEELDVIDFKTDPKSGGGLMNIFSGQTGDKRSDNDVESLSDESEPIIDISSHGPVSTSKSKNSFPNKRTQVTCNQLDENFFRFKNNPSSTFLVKKERLDKNQIQNFKHELEILSHVQQSSYTIDILGYHIKESAILIMKWYPKDLFLAVQESHSDEQRLKWTIQLIKAVIDLHSINPISDDLFQRFIYSSKIKERPRRYILHADLHSRNICLDDDDNLKIADFGASKIVNNSFELVNDITQVKIVIEEIWQVFEPQMDKAKIPCLVNKILKDMRSLVMNIERENEEFYRRLECSENSLDAKRCINGNIFSFLLEGITAFFKLFYHGFMAFSWLLVQNREHSKLHRKRFKNVLRLISNGRKSQKSNKFSGFGDPNLSINNSQNTDENLLMMKKLNSENTTGRSSTAMAEMDSGSTPLKKEQILLTDTDSKILSINPVSTTQKSVETSNFSGNIPKDKKTSKKRSSQSKSSSHPENNTSKNANKFAFEFQQQMGLFRQDSTSSSESSHSEKNQKNSNDRLQIIKDNDQAESLLNDVTTDGPEKDSGFPHGSVPTNNDPEPENIIFREIGETENENENLKSVDYQNNFQDLNDFGDDYSNNSFADLNDGNDSDNFNMQTQRLKSEIVSTDEKNEDNHDDEKFNSIENMSTNHTTGSYSSEETNPMQQFQQMQNFQNFLSNKKDQNKTDDYTSYNDDQENISISSSKYKNRPPVILETIDGRKINMNEIHQQEFNFLTSSFTTGINSNSDLSVNKNDGKDNDNNNNHNIPPLSTSSQNHFGFIGNLHKDNQNQSFPGKNSSNIPQNNNSYNQFIPSEGISTPGYENYNNLNNSNKNNPENQIILSQNVKNLLDVYHNFRIRIKDNRYLNLNNKTIYFEHPNFKSRREEVGSKGK